MMPNGEPNMKPIKVARSTPSFEMRGRGFLPLPAEGAGAGDAGGGEVEAG
jgi:hypothetical protein